MANLASDKKELPLQLSNPPAGKKGRLVRLDGQGEDLDLSNIRIQLTPNEVAVLCIDSE